MAPMFSATWSASQSASQAALQASQYAAGAGGTLVGRAQVNALILFTSTTRFRCKGADFSAMHDKLEAVASISLTMCDTVVTKHRHIQNKLKQLACGCCSLGLA